MLLRGVFLAVLGARGTALVVAPRRPLAASAVVGRPRTGGGGGGGGGGGHQRRWQMLRVAHVGPTRDEHDRAASGCALPGGRGFAKKTRLSAGAAAEEEEEEEEVFVLYGKRWAQLLMVSLLAFISDWVCFATAATPSAFLRATGHEAASLIDIFLVANVGSCLLFTDILRRLGLRRAMVGAAVLMSAGCTLRSGVGDLTAAGAALPPYAAIVAGTVCVGLAQPFFQCAPPLLSATWFGREERALATATALNANQLGIGAAFIVGGAALNGAAGDAATALPRYFEIITTVSVAVTVVVIAAFDSRPPSPPSASAAAAIAAQVEGENEPFQLRYPRTARTLFNVPGFNPALAAFVTSISVTNLISAFAGDALARSAPDGANVAAMPTSAVGAAFQVAIVLGGIGLGAYVDRSRQFKTTVLACLVTAFCSILVLGVASGYDATLPQSCVIASILLLGASIGPVQPIAAELAVEVAHPIEETAVEATQQLSGNLVSAFLVPLYQIAAAYDLEFHYDRSQTWAQEFKYSPATRFISFPEPAFLGEVSRDVRGDSLLLVAIVAATVVLFARSDFVLKRAEFETLGEES